VEVVLKSKTLKLITSVFFNPHYANRKKEGIQIFRIMSKRQIQQNYIKPNVAPEQFDWDSFESGLDADARKEKSDLEEIYNGSLNNLDDNDVIIGKVVRLTDKEAIVDINFKSEGVISLNEFRYNQGLKVGDEVEVMVDRERNQVSYNYLTKS
jgi:ATP-dependent 26S proteasome regulatory subunit